MSGRLFVRGVVALFLCAHAWALDPARSLTQYVHRIWQAQQGLTQGTIYSIWQSHDGYLWLGTQTGLVRFDGIRFTPAERIYPDLPENLFVRDGFEDSNGALWIATNDSGIYRLRDGSVTQYSVKDGLPSDAVTCLVPVKNGDMWACTNNGLARFSGGKIQAYMTGDSSTNPTAACEAPDGRLWAALNSKPEVVVWNGVSFETVPLRSMTRDVGSRAIHCSATGIWVATTGGLVQIQNTQQRVFTEKNKLADDSVLSLAESRDGSLWAGTRNGFSRLRNGELESFGPPEGLSQSNVFAVFEDREGSIWVGTKQGLNQFLDGRSIPYTVSEGLPSNNAGPILQDSAGRIWVGTLDAGLARFDGRHFQTLTVKDGLASNRVLALAEDQDGSLWVGTNRGLNRLRDGKVTQWLSRSAGLPSDEVLALYRDHQGRMWAGTMEGIAVLEHDLFVIPPGVPRLQVHGLAEDHDYKLIFVTEHGAFRVEDGTVHEVLQNGNSLRNVISIFRDPDGLVWMGTYGGGVRLMDAGGKISTIAALRDGLYDGEIFGFTLDKQDRLWMACSKGIFWVPRSELRAFAAGQKKRIVSNPYTPTDALRVIESKSGVQPVVWVVDDGKLWFSTIRGLLVLDTNRMQFNVAPPPVVIEDPLVNGRRERPDRISSLAPGQKNLEFSYAGLSFVVPNRITFRYRLDGYDKDWIEAGTRRDAFYTNLPPGPFQFRVTACNADNVCNEAGSAITFSLTPHLYQRVWFWPVAALCIALAGWLAYQLRIRRIRERYDLILSERSRIARELHDTLIQGFSGITMTLQALAGRLRGSEERRTLEEIIEDAANCLRETRRSVAGLRGAAGPESGLASAISDAARQITETKDVRLKLRLEKGGRRLAPEVEYHLLRIATEAVTNSVKHSRASTIEIALKYSQDSIRLTVSDDGHGFNQHGFGQHSLEPDSGGIPIAGHYGLIGMKERAAQIGAELEFRSDPGRGTTVSLLLMTGRAAALELVK